MAFSQSQKLSELEQSISKLECTDSWYKDLLNEFLNTCLKQFEEFRSQMMHKKRVFDLDPEKVVMQKREITIIWSEIRELVNWKIDETTFKKMKKLFFEAHWIASYYLTYSWN